MKLHKTPELLGVCLTVAVICSTFSVGASSANAMSPAEARYQQDHANCLAGKTAEDQKTCLKEAGAALQAARAHDLKSGNAAQLVANERKRCEPLTGDDKKACVARAEGMGMGTTTGSVAGGGELHEMVTIVPGVQPETAASPATGSPPAPAQGQ